ncbi:PaeR7I family type II restriction endonuclease [Lentzea flava]|uniref:Type-2 restriction enzyme n=1 Tax=Lentzea flava TaxID=103732 RepID=A0ABQ2UCW2_9PSEU|nr:PaeR7I family type II restriction endonuclease [Lentzea flava]MCP2197702.1 Restriction endonuclease XhoI [Lentzea flava]GGU21582.1 type-2 restriction enzyme [Lentzea flava]
MATISGDQIQAAVEEFWFKRDEQTARLPDGGAAGGAARAGGHIGGFERVVKQLFVEAGVPESSIYVGTPTLPGHYRVAKQWDLVVIYEGNLVAAIEFKSQVGSVGKNYNNRFEEALGSATDVHAAQQEFEPFGQMSAWLGYVFILQESTETERPLRPARTLFPPDRVFEGLTYSQRYQTMIQRFFNHKVYQGGWFLTTKRDPDGGVSYDEPMANACAATFAAEIVGRVNVVMAAVAAEKKRCTKTGR